MSDFKLTEAERLIAHTETLDQANKIRCHLLHHKPTPGVYVYQSDWEDESEGFDVKVATPWSGHLSDESFNSLINHLASEEFEGVIAEVTKKKEEPNGPLN